MQSERCNVLYMVQGKNNWGMQTVLYKTYIVAYLKIKPTLSSTKY